MEIPKFIKGIAKYFTYASDSGETTPTTQADLQELMKNNNTILECLVDGLWQPEKEMQLNQIIRSPNMPANMVAKVTAAGTTGTIEPNWIETVGTTVSDGNVTFTMFANIINSYTKTETDAKLKDKADLVEGKVPIGQLPEMDYVSKTGDTTIDGILSVTSPPADSNNEEVPTTSWVRTLISKYIVDNILSICGVTYLLEQNGYVRVGILGGFTIQWGYNSAKLLAGGIVITFPTAYSKSVFSVVGVPTATLGGADLAAYSITSVSQTNFTVVGDALTNGVKTSYIRWISVGC